MASVETVRTNLRNTQKTRINLPSPRLSLKMRPKEVQPWKLTAYVSPQQSPMSLLLTLMYLLLELIFSVHVSIEMVNIMLIVCCYQRQGTMSFRQVKAHRYKCWNLGMNLPVEGLKCKQCSRKVLLVSLPEEASPWFSL